jgi:UDP-N-acetylglucosamine 4-epimerase
VFGPRQDPDGPYASVIPAWIGALLRGETAYVNGDGLVARDFCYVDNVVQANFLAAVVEDPQATGEIYNVAVGAQTTLLQLFELIRARLAQQLAHLADARPVHRAPRLGDMQLSRADVSKAARLLGYSPTYDLAAGLKETIDWYIGQLLPAEQRRLALV